MVFPIYRADRPGSKKCGWVSYIVSITPISNNILSPPSVKPAVRKPFDHILDCKDYHKDGKRKAHQK
jgi:hypothetical protein